MNPSVIPWTTRLEKGTDFWESSVVVVDANDDPVTLLSTELTIFPEGKDPIVWNPANGKLTMPSAGHFTFDIPRAEIDTYDWVTADYKWSVTYTNGKVDGNWMEGQVKVDAY